jgi:hypothetical protein
MFHTTTKTIEPPIGQKVGFKIRVFDLYFNFFNQLIKPLILKFSGNHSLNHSEIYYIIKINFWRLLKNFGIKISQK